MASDGETEIDVTGLKESVKKVATQAKQDKDFDRLEVELLKKHTPKPAEKLEPIVTEPQAEAK